MGQYYLIANMDKKEYIESNRFLKLMEWSYNRNPVVLKLEELLHEQWKGDRVYVIGDYADSENFGYHTDIVKKLEKEFLNEDESSLYFHIANHFKNVEYDENIHNDYRYIFNHNKKQYVDMEHCPLEMMLGAFKDHGKWYHATIAPLPLLLALGNGLGGGDYFGNNKYLVGSWVEDSRHLEISEKMLFPEYKELQPDFYEGEKVPYHEKEKLIRIEKQRLKEGRDR